MQGAANKRALDKLSVSELVDITRRAARLFANADLPLGDCVQTPEDYVRQVSGTTGMPEALCRANTAKIQRAGDEIEPILGGLTRGLNLSVLDGGWCDQKGRFLSYICQTDALGAILPSNSPGVHALWLPPSRSKCPWF